MRILLRAACVALVEGFIVASAPEVASSQWTPPRLPPYAGGRGVVTLMPARAGGDTVESPLRLRGGLGWGINCAFSPPELLAVAEQPVPPADLSQLSEDELISMLRDIRGPKALVLPIPPWKWAVLAGIMAVLAGVVAGCLVRALRQRAVIPAPPPPSDVTAREQALRELDELRRRQLWQQGRYVELSDHLSAILKRFVARSAIAHAENLTTTELALALGDGRQDEIRRLEDILRGCDFAKFARQQRFATDPVLDARAFVLEGLTGEEASKP